ncbi:MAG: DUF916 domain-containing protein [Parcubacteria group bacterium]
MQEFLNTSKMRIPHGFLKKIRTMIAVVSFFVAFSIANAAGPLSLGISPLSYDLKVDPGEEKTGKLYIENTSDEDIDVTAEFSNFFVDDSGKYIFSGERDIKNENLKPYLMNNWMSVNENNFTLRKGENRVVDYKISIPDDAILGGHYGVIFFRTACEIENDKAAVSTDNSSICVSGRVGTLFLVQVGGEAVKKGILKKIDVPKLSLENSAKLAIEIGNDGNTHFQPEGEIITKNLFGQELSRMEIKDKTILPTMSRTFSENLARMDFFGFYKIQGLIKDGDGNEMKFNKYIFMPPWKEAITTALIVGALIWFFNKFKIKKIKKNKKETVDN